MPLVSAVMAAKSDKPVRQIDVAALQAKLREQKQAIDFLEGKPEKFEEGKREKEF